MRRSGGYRAAERCPSWPKEHDWKSCIRQKRIWGSNPHLSARFENRCGCARIRSCAAPFSERRRCAAHGQSPANRAGRTPCGGVAERLNAAVSKTVSPVTPVTRVRIPAPPPVSIRSPEGALGAFSCEGGPPYRRAARPSPACSKVLLQMPDCLASKAAGGLAAPHPIPAPKRSIAVAPCTNEQLAVQAGRCSGNGNILIRE